MGSFSPVTIYNIAHFFIFANVFSIIFQLFLKKNFQEFSFLVLTFHFAGVYYMYDNPIRRTTQGGRAE